MTQNKSTASYRSLQRLFRTMGTLMPEQLSKTFTTKPDITYRGSTYVLSSDTSSPLQNFLYPSTVFVPHPTSSKFDSSEYCIIFILIHSFLIFLVGPVNCLVGLVVSKSNCSSRGLRFDSHVGLLLGFS